MPLDQQKAVELATEDLAKRLGVKTGDIDLNKVEKRDFSDMSLGAPEEGEMAAQMISSGWSIKLGAAGKEYEYRADKYQLRLHNFNGANLVIM